MAATVDDAETEISDHDRIKNRKLINVFMYATDPNLKKEFSQTMANLLSYGSFQTPPWLRMQEPDYSVEKSIADWNLRRFGPVEIWIYAKGFSGRFKVKFINPFLTDDAYQHPSIIHSSGAQSPISSMLEAAAGFNGDDVEAKESEFDPESLEMRHLMEADSFMIVYDMRDVQSLEKTKKYIQRIFRVRGYDETLSKMKRDEMCTFPISLVGINRNFVKKDGEEYGDKVTESVSTNSAAHFAMEHCVDFMVMELYKTSPHINNWELNYEVKSDLVLFVQHSLEYYYYLTLSDEEVDALKVRPSSVCTLL